MDKKTVIIILISLAALGAVGYLTLMLDRSHNEMDALVDFFNEEKMALISDYDDLYSDFDSLRSNNEELNFKLELERERIAQLQEELKTVKATNARRIKELQAELNSTRAIMRSFVRQVDSLNQLNVQLTAENKTMRSQVASIRQSNQELSKRNDALNQKINIASRLEARGVEAVGLNLKEKKVNSSSKVNKIKVSFTVMKNVTAPVGMRDFFLRITRPDGQLLMHSKTDVFDYEDTQLNFSAKRAVEYGGDDTETYIVYTVDSGELMGGVYDLEIFCGGESIGSGVFSLKN